MAIIEKSIIYNSTGTEVDFIPRLGAVTEAAPASDTASSGLNGRLQRIAQRLTSLIAFFINGSGTAAAAIRVELPTDGTGKVGLNAGTAIIGKVIIDNATPGTTDRVTANIDKVGGTAIDTNSGNKSNGTQRMVLATDQPTLTSPLNVALQLIPTGGATVFHLASAASTNATNIKASAGKVTGWFIYNSNAAARKIAFHNSASTPTAGTAVYYSLVIPPTSGANVSFEAGIDFSAGIGITTVTGLADSDSAAVALNDLIINVFYK